MGSLIVEELRQRAVPLVVIDANRDLAADLQDAGVPFLIGDATHEELLVQSGLMHARALVIALPSDADNVYITLTVHALYPDLTIIARAEQPAAEPKLKRAGATRVVCPQVAGAMTVANVLTRPTVVDFVELASKGVDLEIDEYIIADNSPLVGKTIRESYLRRKTGAVVVAIKQPDREAILSPDPDAVLSSGDTLILVGPSGISGRLDELGSEP